MYKTYLNPRQCRNLSAINVQIANNQFFTKTSVVEILQVQIGYNKQAVD